ncbi:hypothetical protein ACPMJQ_28980 [Streptomyces pseudogriseolus]|uniref:hypothetical protein n=1 Tax=Streptomyces pseudogriseolus TaxID=36817 RepID=UPI003FA24C0F
MIAASVTDRARAAEAASHTIGPHLSVAAAALSCLHEPDARGVIDLPADPFPGAPPALDTAGRGFFATQDRHDVLGKVETLCAGTDPFGSTGRLAAGCSYWGHTFTSLPQPVVAQSPLPYRQLVSAVVVRRPGFLRRGGHQLNLLRLP